VRLNHYPQETLQNGGIGVDTTPHSQYKAPIKMDYVMLYAWIQQHKQNTKYQKGT